MVPRRSIFGLAAVLAAAMTLLACAEGPEPAAMQLRAEGQSRIYRLGPGDKLKITVYGEPDLSGTFEVNALGHVAMPLVGDVEARGKPATELRSAIARKLSSGFLVNPKVSVEVVNYRPIYVHGEVRNGGEFGYKSGIKMRDAVAMAGGYTYRANTNYLLLTREGEAREMRVQLPSDVDVMPGDNIRVPERFF